MKVRRASSRRTEGKARGYALESRPATRSREVAARPGSGRRQPSQPQVAVAADHARDDLRRFCSGGDALHRRRSATEGDGFYRAAGRTEPYCSGKRSAELPGSPEGAPDVARAYLEGL